MAGTRPEQPEADTAQPLAVLSGFEAVERVECVICPNGVARVPAVAEGLALAGVRAASLSNGLPMRSAAGIAALEASCVHHVDGAGARERGGVFEFAAASVQEAVDHCLAAHLLSRRLGRAGVCSLAPSLGEDLKLVRLPGAALIAAVLETDKEPPELDAEADRILELAQEALRTVGDRTERPGNLVDYEGNRRAAVVLVGAGADAARAREAARVLSEAGVQAGILALNLVQPFPEAPVREALASARKVLVLEDPSRGGGLLARVRAAVDKKTEVHPVESAAPAQLLEAVSEQLPEGAFDPKQHAPTEPPLGRRLVVAPAGAWGEETARQVASALGYLGPLRLAPRTRRHLGATILVWGSEAIPEEGGDLLLTSHPALLEPRGALALLRPGSTLAVLSRADSSDELARLLSPDARTALAERKLRVHWVAPPQPDEGEPGVDGDREATLALAGAALAALCAGGKADGAKAAATVADRLEAEGRGVAARWLREGAERVRSLDPADLDPARHVEELDFRLSSNLPRMPEPMDDPEARERWAERIRRFHWTGKGAFSVAAGLPVRPAVLENLAGALRTKTPHPFVLVGSDDPERPVAARSLRDLLTEGTASLAGAGGTTGVLMNNLERLATLATQLLMRRAPGTDLGSLLSEAGRRLVEELSPAEDEAKQLVEDLEQLRQRLPDGSVVDLRAGTPLRLYLVVLEAVRAPLRRRFTEELEGLRERLRDLLELDRMGSTEGRSAESLASAFGRSAADHLDPAALSRTLAVSAGAEALPPERRRRIETVLATIEKHLEQQDQLPGVIFLRPPGLDLGLPGAEQRAHPDPLAAAVGLFDGMARRMAPLLQAARVARLEVDGHYRPEAHDEALADLDWEAFTADELLLVPAVSVVTSGRRLRQADQAALSELLRSSRPVHLIVQDEVGAPDEAEDLSRFHIDLGHLVVAHREAYAVGSTLARPDQLVQALTRVARALRPAVALMRLASQQPAPWRALLAEAALQGRVSPEFRYDPDAGPSWADRFDLEGNPEPERPWPIHRVSFIENGSEDSLEVSFTFADAVAIEPAYLHHLRIVPRAAWDDTHLPLAEYLERFDPEARESWIPYVWVVDEEQTLQRAVVTRELAMACRERLRSWRVLQELAGHDNVFAKRAAATARDQAQVAADAQRAELEQAHNAELERVRSETARESMERLAAALMSPEGVSIGPSTFPAPRAPGLEPVPLGEPGAAAALEPAAVEAVLEEEEVLAFDEPYIDAPLCTTCNECTNINARLFQYNADKQAFISDPAAGSFAELVRAAELCPAHCIHPGKPRSDDSTATPELVERAAKFN